MSFAKNVKPKSRTIRDPFCTVCEQFLIGNGSIAHPWRCDCGVYEFDHKAFEYSLPQKQKKD